MMVENRENILEEEITGKNDINIPELQFTGNWFIDTGILGFINVMKEVYGWNLEELKNRIKENPELIYYGYFPFAYLFYHSKIRTNFKEMGDVRNKKKNFIEKRNDKQKELSTFIKSMKNANSNKIPKKDLNKIKSLKKKILEFETEIDELDSKINELNSNLSHEKQIFSTQIESNIDEILSDSENMFTHVKDKIDGIILDFDLKTPQGYRNFFLYNPKKDIFLSFLYLHSLLRKNFSKIKLIKYLKNQESLLEFINFCQDISVNYMDLIDTIEKMLYLKKKKSKIINFCGEKFCLDEESMESINKKWYIKIQKEYGKIGESLSYEVSPDFTANPFLYSPTEFSNIGYTKPLTLDEIESGLKVKLPIYLLLLSFSNAFQRFARRNILFYTNNLKLSYSINSGIRTKISRMGKRDSIFKMTWSSIIDELIENKAKFSLENMYLIEFEGIGKDQKLKDVRYLGITKLGASIIIEDAIRDALNSNIQINSGKNSEWVWLLEEFIKNRPIYPHILKHAVLRINNKTKQKAVKPLLYGLSVDAKIKSLSKDKGGRIFEQYFSLELEDTVFQIKESYKWMNLASKNASKVFSSDIRDKFVPRLITTIKKQNKHAFMNTILKALLEERKTDPKIVKYLNNYLFNNIIQNETNWQNYALAILVGLL
ncbi:MAG: hypothetical protein QMD61_02490 [Methanobacterium sp.]|nr:hypothetical protein [Methanobacterium sp.]